jgi:hypothetical protein
MKTILQEKYILNFFSKCIKRKENKLVLTILFLALANAVDAQTTTNRFNDGFISVFRNTSASTLGSTGTAIVIDEFSPITTGQTTANFSVTLPNTASAGSTGIVSGATTSSNGSISRSENGRYLLIPGWSTDTSIPGNTTAIGAANSTYLYCAVRPINGSGVISTGVTGTSNWFSAANDYRGATSDDGTNYWVSGASLGVRTTTNGTTLTTVSTTSTNTRALNIINGQLYYSTGSGTQGVYQVGIGKPLTASTISTNLTTSTGAYGFAISPDFLTLYTNSATGVISRFTYSGSYNTVSGTYSGGTWSSASTGFTLASATGLTVDWSNYSYNTGSNGAVIYASNTVAGTSVLVKANDNGTAAMTTVTVASVSGNNIFKQIAFSPIKQTVSLGSNSPATGSLLANANNVPLFQFSLSADEGNSTLKKLILSQNGTATIGTGNSISNFRLIEDLDNNGVASPSELLASLATGSVVASKINFSVPVNTANYIQQGSSRNYIIIGDVSSTGSGTFIPSIVSNNTINSVAYTSNLVNAGGSLVTIGTNSPTGNALTIVNSTTWDGTSWSNTIGPDATIEAIINGTYNTKPIVDGGNGTFSAKKLTVNADKFLTINSGTNLTVQNEVINNGSLVVENNANLIQVNNTPNTGVITVNRNSNALSRLDYTMWSSPVSGQNLVAFSPLTSLSPSRFYTYNSTANLYNEILDPTVYTLLPSVGVLVRMPNTAVTAPATEIFTGVFTGVPNNGTVNLTALTSDSYYAVGNPYTSTISAESFLAGNATDGILYFWRKTNGASGSAYATYSAGGATSTTASSEVPNGTIQVGEGFIVKTGVAATSLTFTNAMREITPTSTQFFKTKKLVAKDRVWLNLTNTDGVFSQALVGYMAGATQGVDAGIDGKYINDSPIALTSNINNEEYTIQLRGSFDASDVVPLNFKTDKAGDYTIAIDHTEGVFASGQEVILLDSTTGKETSLNASSYTFTTAAGTDNSRFALKYQKTLGTNQPVLSDTNVTVYKNKGVLFVNAGDSIIANIEVYDVQGKLVVELKNVKATSASIPNLKLTNQVLVVKITSQDNKVVTKKVVN